ncbi:hypothetical protein BYT27DRAFT_7182369 [Phlegmacium glaucopus]|nr:hypothetical protein BYT27DRAFT_7182369 [Phlegmacium glaucopus]
MYCVRLATGDYDNSLSDETQALKWQAAQVSPISVSNSGGQIMIGFFSDFAKKLCI